MNNQNSKEGDSDNSFIKANFGTDQIQNDMKVNMKNIFGNKQNAKSSF